MKANDILWEMRRFLAPFSIFTLLLAAGCASRGPAVTTTSVASQPAPFESSHKLRSVILYVPQTDEGAAHWLELFAKHPSLRMAIAISPRFQKFAKDAVLRGKFIELQKAGRLELPLQLPNPPILPLLVDTQSARDALPAGYALPSPPYSYPDDVVQLVARAKADYFRTWRALPHALVLPYGAASPRIFSLFDRLGFTWLAAAIAAPAVDGPYRSGSFTVWDSTPSTPSVGTEFYVWDERQMKGSSLKTLEAWVRHVETTGKEFTLPSEKIYADVPLPPETQWARRTWQQPDWSSWIGTPRKNAAWEWLRRTRQALEAYKNSGRASIARLDAAFEEVFMAESATYLGAIGNKDLPAHVSEEREREFQATLGGVYRLMNQPPPDDLFQVVDREATGFGSATQTKADTTSNGLELVVISEAEGDDKGDGTLASPAGSIPGLYDLRSLGVSASTETVTFTLTMTAGSGFKLGGPPFPGPLIDLYLDLNGQPNVGTGSFLSGRGLNIQAKDAWEYALVVTDPLARLYRTQSGSYELAGTFPVTVQASAVQVALPRSLMRGNPRRWGYQVLVMSCDPRSSRENPLPLKSATPESLSPVYDLLDPLEMNQTQLLQDIFNSKRSDVPFVRVRK